MFEPFEIKLLKVAGSLWLKIVAGVVAAALSGCIGSAEAKLTGSPESFRFEDSPSVRVLPKPQTESLPPAAAPVERSSLTPAPQPAVDNAPGAAQLPEVLVYGPPSCAPCNRAIKELNDSGKYAAAHATITPAIQKIANEWNQGSYPIVTFRDRKSDERFVAPYRGLKDFDQRYNRTMKDRAATGMQDAAPPNVAAQSFNAAQFVQEFQVRNHLVRDHGFTSTQVAAMTDQQVIDAHNAAHQVWGGFTGQRPGRLARKGKL